MKKITATLIFALMCFVVFSQEKKEEKKEAIVASTDLNAEIDQSAFDKILLSMPIPFTLFEHNSPFPNNLIELQGDKDLPTIEGDEVSDINKLISIFQWAVEGQAQETTITIYGDNANEFKVSLQTEWASMKDEISTIVTNYDYAKENQGKPGYNGPTTKDFEGSDIPVETLRKWQKSDVKNLLSELSKNTKTKGFVQAHLAYLKVVLEQRPSLVVNSPSFNVNGILVKATATGELWLKFPTFRCCKRVFGICVWVCFDGWKWKRTASITISPKVGANATVTFTINQLLISASANCFKLYLDYPILRDINLASIANIYLRNKSFDIYDVSKYIASIPYINQKFRVSSISLPPRPKGISIDINIQKQ